MPGPRHERATSSSLVEVPRTKHRLGDAKAASERIALQRLPAGATQPRIVETRLTDRTPFRGRRHPRESSLFRVLIQLFEGATHRSTDSVLNSTREGDVGGNTTNRRNIAISLRTDYICANGAKTRRWQG